MKVTLYWCVVADGDDIHDLIQAEREIEMPFAPFIGMHIMFCVDCAPADFVRPTKNGKRELQFIVTGIDYWPETGVIDIWDDEHVEGNTAYDRSVWFQFLQDAGFVVRPTVPRRHLRSVKP